MSAEAIDRTRRTTPRDPIETEGSTTGAAKPAPWHQDVPVTTNDPVDLGDVFKNMLAHPDADAVMFLGMNTEAATQERAELEKKAHVVTISSDLNANRHLVTFDGRTYDVAPAFLNGERVVDSSTHVPARSQARDLFIAMGMPKEKADAIAAMTDALPQSTARVELCEVAFMMWKGEQGAPIPSRLLFSGHSGGGVSAYGSGGLHFHYEALRFLAKQMPNAARQIEDIHFGTCSSLNNVTLDLAEWRDAFPRLKTIWAYEKSAGTGAAADQREWERQTRGRSDALTMTPGMQQKLVATWSAHDGKVRGLGPYAELADKRTAAWRRLNEAFRGGSTDPRTLEADYRLFRELAQRSELDEKERVVVRQSADQALRLRYYSDVAARFQRAHAAEISAAYRAAGLPVPDFSRLSRAEARDVIKRFVTSKLEGDYPPAIEATRTLLTNFDSLDSRVIPDAWCQHETQGRRH